MLQVMADVILFLQEKDWEKLGVATVGDRVVLVQICKANISKFKCCIIGCYLKADLYADERSVKSELHSRFQSTSPTVSNVAKAESANFAERAGQLCNTILVSGAHDRPRSFKSRRRVPVHHSQSKVKDDMRNLI